MSILGLCSPPCFNRKSELDFELGLISITAALGPIVHDFFNDATLGTFTFDMSHLEQGYDYRLCIDFNVSDSSSYFYGDTEYWRT